MTDSIDARPPIPPLESRRETVSRLLETGYNHRAVAMYGTTIDNTRNILATGVIPSYPPTLPYQHQLLEKGGHLYYFMPITEKLQSSHPELITSMKEGLQVPNEQAERELSITRTLKSASEYAHSNAIKHHLKTHGINSYIAQELIEAFNDGYDLSTEHGRAGYTTSIRESASWGISVADQIELFQLSADPKYANILKQAFLRKGVVLFFNDRILQETTVLPGQEDPHEFMVVSKTPFKLDVISGMAVQTGEEKEELLAA